MTPSGPRSWIWDGYSLAERDRRWAAVRALAAAAGLDCVFVPLGNAADMRYLTQLRSGVAVLPTAGGEPLAIADRGARNAWVPEPRHTSRAWAEPMAQALLDAGMEGARIGVVGLRGGVYSHVSATDGVVDHSPFEHVRQRLPRASFEDATDIVGEARWLKGDEEIECLRRAGGMALAGLDHMEAELVPGADAGAVFARTMARLLRLGSDYAPMALTIDGARHTIPPAGLALAAGTVVGAELTAVWGAQQATVVQTVVVGHGARPAPATFEAALARLRPGAALGEAAGDARLRGLGMGDDGPVLGTDTRELRLQSGTAWLWEADGWAWSVVVQAAGARLLA